MTTTSRAAHKCTPIALRNLARRAEHVPGELHPMLRDKASRIIERMDGRVAWYCGFRGRDEQEDAYRAGVSRARFGDSPHNFVPALAVDLVLNPARVRVAAHPDAPHWPWLWDDRSPEAVEAWSMLDDEAKREGLVRITLGRSRPDLPHLELPDWRGLVGQ